jgi:hypothetical protein
MCRTDSPRRSTGPAKPGFMGLSTPAHAVQTQLYLFTLIVTLIALATALIPVARANVIYVPEDVTWISEALQLAGPGDTISVAPGTYMESLVWPPVQGIKLLSRVPRAATIIPPIETPVISMTTPLDATTVIDGFVLQSGWGPYGGGIFCQQASPTISNNHLLENRATNLGGGIACLEASPLITGNRIETSSAQLGGGLYWDSISSPVVVADTIVACTADQGSGIFALGGGEIRSCLIEGNLGAGAGIHASGFATIEGCRIESNSARGICCEYAVTIRGNELRLNAQGGIYIASGSTLLIEGNLIEDHIAGDGAGIFSMESHATIRRNTIRDNDSRGGLAGGIYIHGGAPLVEYNQITGNNTNYEASGIYCCMDSTTLRGNNISHNICDQTRPVVGSGLFI